MNSLRARLTLGVALVAVVPLAIAMFVLSQRIQATVRAQSSERLASTLEILTRQLHSDGAQITRKLDILGRDPTLKRLYLIRRDGGRDLVADTNGVTVADGAQSSSDAAGSIAARAGLPAHSRSSGPMIVRLTDVPGLVMIATAPILYQNETSGMVGGGVVLDTLFLRGLERTSGVDLILRDAGGAIVATTLDSASTSGLPSRPSSGRVRLAGRSYLFESLTLNDGAGPGPTITGLVSTASADQTLAALRTTSLLLGLASLAIAIGLGMLWSRQVSRPVERLAAFSHRIAQGEWDEPLTVRSVREIETLVAALDRMRTDLSTYREKLRASERQAAWSQMARKIAHEIKNPLTPIAISVADLQRSFEQKRPDFPQILEQAARTIGDEVQALKRLLQEFSEFGSFPKPEIAPCRGSELMTDLGALYRGEVAANRLAFDIPEREIVFDADRAQVRQALVNLIKNALEAIGDAGRVTVSARSDDSATEWAVSDNGPGLGAEAKARLFVPDFTTKPHGSGLGLTIVERIVSDHGGSIAVDSEPGRGTTFRLRFPTRHEAI
jgi:signal transduction histidine kinase